MYTSAEESEIYGDTQYIVQVSVSVRTYVHLAERVQSSVTGSSADVRLWTTIPCNYVSSMQHRMVE